MRAFIAVDVEEAIAEKLEEVTEQLQNYDTKCVKLENMHLTLKFLGEVDKDEIELIKKKLAKVAEGQQSFSIGFKGLGVFPHPGRINVVWAGIVQGTESVINLQNDINSALSNIFTKEEKEKVPHLTIARVRSGRYKQEIMKVVDEHKDKVLGSMVVKSIKLKKSTLTPRGPVYENLVEFELK